MVIIDKKCQWAKSMMRKQELLLLSNTKPLFNYTPDYLEKNIMVALKTLEIALSLWHDLPFMFYWFPTLNVLSQRIIFYDTEPNS